LSACQGCSRSEAPLIDALFTQGAKFIGAVRETVVPATIVTCYIILKRDVWQLLGFALLGRIARAAILRERLANTIAR
jgi:hypothetical protein